MGKKYQHVDHADGDVNQIYGKIVNVTINKDEAPAGGGKKKWWEQWHNWVIVVTATLMLFGLIIELPGKIKKNFGSEKNMIVIADSVKFEGVVVDITGTPLPGTTVSMDVLPGKSVIATTDGGFIFSKVPGKPGDRVRVYALHPAYKPRDQYFVLGPERVVLEKK